MTMVDTPAAADDPGEVQGSRPPAGYPHTDWAPQGDVYFVPPELREHYAAANGVGPTTSAAFWDGGATLERLLNPREAHERAVAAGRSADELAAKPQLLILHPGETILTRGKAGHEQHWLRIETAADGIDAYVELEHQTRLENARTAQQRAQIAERERAMWTCPGCKQLAPGSLNRVASTHPLASRASLCTPCRAVAERLLGDRELVDGRLRVELVEQYLERLEAQS